MIKMRQNIILCITDPDSVNHCSFNAAFDCVFSSKIWEKTYPLFLRLLSSCLPEIRHEEDVNGQS